MTVEITPLSLNAQLYDACIEKLRAEEYKSLQTTTYLDHAGTTLYAASLLDAFHKDLTTNLFGNPHSISPASNLSTIRVEEARSVVLSYFNADPTQFDVIFTSSATAAIKIVADCFRDQSFDYYYHRDSHSSIVGVRELAATSQCLISNEDVENFIKQADISTRLELFAYPAQSNMTGYRPPLRWSRQLRKHSKNAYILLDAASYLTSARLDLSTSANSPDFIALSFYKIFGFPTGLGALIVRKASSGVLRQRRYFGGGTVDQVTVIGGQTHAIKDTSLHDRLEDGTLPFQLIASLKHAIDVQSRLFASAQLVSSHTAGITRWLYESMDRLRHKNGNRVTELYKDSYGTYGDAVTQGPIIAFSILRSDGTYIGKSQFERLANECAIQIRTGGVCNPGGIASMLKLQHWELRRNFAEGVRCGDDVDIMGSKPTGIIRVSLGPMSTMSDVRRFIGFLQEFFVDQSSATIPKRNRSDGIITPVKGCSGFYVNYEDYAAYQSWHDQWCLVMEDSNKTVQAGEHNIKATIDVQAEVLVFDNELKVSLWDMPNASEPHPLGAKEERKWDIYEGPINDWLSKKVGSPCFLARYRAVNIRERPESLTCVVSGCYAQQSSAVELNQHYALHAQAFRELYPFDVTNVPQTLSHQPITAGAICKATSAKFGRMVISIPASSTEAKNTFFRTDQHHVREVFHTDSSEDFHDSKTLRNTERKPRKDVMRRLFSRSKC